MAKIPPMVFALAIATSSASLAQEVGPAGSQAELCRTTGLAALKEQNPAIKNLTLDLDGLTIAEANTKIEDTSVRTIIFGDAYLERGNKETRRMMLCLIGDKGKVLLTFFTEK